MMTNEQKQEIRDRLERYTDQVGGQNQAAAILGGVSSGTISQILNGKWDKIAEKMWLNISGQLWDFTPESADEQWRGVSTRPYNELMTTFEDARRRSMAMAVVADAGTGKSYTARRYAAENGGLVFCVTCKEGWKLKAFLKEVLRVLGKSASASDNDNEAMYAVVVETLRRKPRPALIIDEADKLHNEVFLKFIDLFNDLEDRCALVLMATSYLETRLMNGAKRGARGYREIFSRVGNRCVQINHADAADVRAICLANGVTDAAEIAEITNDADGDLRRVKRSIIALQLDNGTRG